MVVLKCSTIKNISKDIRLTFLVINQKRLSFLFFFIKVLKDFFFNKILHGKNKFNSLKFILTFFSKQLKLTCYNF